MTRTTVRVAVAMASVLAVLALDGCGMGGHDGGYCGAVKDHQSDLGSIVHGGARGDAGTALISALPIFENLRDKAPDDVAGDWQLVVTRIQALDTALEKAGVDPATYDAKNPPSGLSPEARSLIRRAAAQLAASDTHQALATVQQEVLDVCQTPLDL